MASVPVPPNQGERLWPVRDHSIRPGSSTTGTSARNYLMNAVKTQPRQRYSWVGLSSRPGKGKSMTLRKKTRLIFGMALIGLFGVMYAASSTLLLGNLKKAEEQDTRKIVEKVLGVFAQTQDDFNSRYANLAAWDDTYTFIEDANERYVKSNLAPEQLALADINLALYIHSSGQIVFGTGFDLKNKKKTFVPDGLRKHLSAKDLLLQHPSSTSNLVGIVLLAEGPMLISSRPILTSKGEGPIRGTLIFGRYLDANEIQKLGRTTRLSLTMHRVNEGKIPPELQAVRSSLSVKEQILVRPLSKQTIAGYALLNDIYGNPALVLQVDMLREIYNQRQSSLHYLMASLFVAGLMFSGVTLPLLERLLLFQYERREKDERYRAVVQQASEGIFLVDANTKRFLEANAAFQNLLSYTEKELLALTLDDVVADERESKSINHDLHYIQTKKHHLTSEWRFSCKNGSLVDVQVSVNLISYYKRNAFCIVVRDITQSKWVEEALWESERRLSWQVSHDPLTELVNRREFEQHLEQAVFSAKNSCHQHVLCYLDLDQFKIVNDTCGHVAGDALLRQVSTLFKTELGKIDILARLGGDEFGLLVYLRKKEILARLGGDEFGLLLYQCPLEPALQIANMLRERIQEFCFRWQDKVFSISVSIGLVVINADSQSKQCVLSAADAACYAAKNKGRNRVHIYQFDDRELAQQRGEMQWVSRIQKALEENRFRLYHQRIVPINKIDKSEHCEVLLRLEDETGKIISPIAFIPAAERYQLMHLIDRWVISTLFAYLGQQYQDWDSFCGYNPSLYAVNLSGASINNEDFINFVQEQFALYRIPPSIICFEITETVAITNLSKAAQLMSELKSIGCHFALDDFGSGMSSFTYLKNLPVDYLKIDGAFIKDILKDAIASEMVEAMSHIASVMRIQTIAEFVENDAIFMKLKALGVDYAQGYGIAKPCPLF